MTTLDATLVKIARFFDQEGISYMVIGGVANLFWGVPRTTLDVDVTAKVNDERIPELVRTAGQVFRVRVSEPEAFIKQTHVLPLEDSNGVRVDVVFGQLDYETRAIARAKTADVQGTQVRICSPEDLIIHKIVSDRPQDQEDAKGIIRKMGSQLDRLYLDPLISDLSQSLAKPTMLRDYLTLFSDLK